MKKKPELVTWNVIIKSLSALKDGFEFRLREETPLLDFPIGIRYGN